MLRSQWTVHFTSVESGTKGQSIWNLWGMYCLASLKFCLSVRQFYNLTSGLLCMYASQLVHGNGLSVYSPSQREIKWKKKIESIKFEEREIIVNVVNVYLQFSPIPILNSLPLMQYKWVRYLWNLTCFIRVKKYIRKY